MPRPVVHEADLLGIGFAVGSRAHSVENCANAVDHLQVGSLGITADGYLDRATNQIALKGTLAPVYGLNSVLGAIPLLGDVLVSKQGEGIIGMTYSVSGNADQPNLSVNPLSALAPGILRRIFEGSMPVAPQPAAPPSQANTGQPPVPQRQ